jgi:hypothetical protein
MLKKIIKHNTYIKHWLIQYNLEWLAKFKWMEKYSWLFLNILLLTFVCMFEPKSNELTNLKRRINSSKLTKSSFQFVIKLILFLISLYFLMALKLNYKYL